MKLLNIIKAHKWWFAAAALLIILLVIVLLGQRLFFRPTSSQLPQVDQSGAEPHVVAEGLEIPWEVRIFSSGAPTQNSAISEVAGILVTERPGVLRRLGANAQSFEIAGVAHEGEGGLLGLALHPDFSSSPLIYLYFTARADGKLINRVMRYQILEDKLINETLIIDNIPAGSRHNGGRIEFGPDGLLYITTGDSGQEDLAQDVNSLAGKILRLRDDGSAPADNPFGNSVYSYGHRNPQGLAWDDKGQLWSTEHGRSGAASGFDEINLIKPGANYGWPHIEGDESRPGMQRPVIHSGPDETWAPAGIAYADGSLWFSGLRGQSLYQAKIGDDNALTLFAHLRQVYGRLRAVVLGTDGLLYISTSNTDGRGNPRSGDDRIIKILPPS